MYIRRVICLKTLLKLGNCYNSEDIDFRSMNERWKREIFPFKTLFEWFRYDFSFSRYRGAKSKVIFNCLLCLSSSLSRVALTYPKLQTSDRQAISGKMCAKEVVHISRKKNVGQWAATPFTILCIMSLKRYGNFESLQPIEISRWINERSHLHRFQIDFCGKIFNFLVVLFTWILCQIYTIIEVKYPQRDIIKKNSYTWNWDGYFVANRA